MTVSERGPMPRETALQLCEQILERKARRPFTQCRGCVKALKGNVERMCIRKPLGYRGWSL